jgi:hypothetical protein
MSDANLITRHVSVARKKIIPLRSLHILSENTGEENEKGYICSKVYVDEENPLLKI